MAHMEGVFKQLECDVQVNEKAYKMDVSHAQGKDDEGFAMGTITMHAQIFVLADSLHLVEIRRGRGDIIAYKAVSEKVRGMMAPLKVAG